MNQRATVDQLAYAARMGKNYGDAGLQQLSGLTAAALDETAALCVAVSIPTSGWANAAAGSPAAKYVDVPVAAALPTHVPYCDIPVSSAAVAVECGLVGSTEPRTGTLRFWADKAPAAAIPVTVALHEGRTS